MNGNSMTEPQPTPKDHLQNKGTVELSITIDVLSDRIESYRRPSKLYGRDVEIETLSTVYRRFIDQLQQRDDTNDVTTSEFILIHGDTGIGKSALIQKFFMEQTKPVTIDVERCFCIRGEFDQRINLRTPNTAYLDAFTSYVQKVKEYQLLDKFRNLLQQSNIRDEETDVLIKMIPALSDLFDRRESPNNQLERSNNIATGLPNIPISDDAFSAFKYALLKFLRVVATTTYPIVLILEDMHHADESALNLMTFLMNHTNTNTLLFVGTTRDDVNSEGLEIMLRKLSSHATIVTHVHLHNLDTISTMAMISDVLDMTDRNLLHIIQEIIQNQTICNPYGILTFLSAMVKKRCWSYDTTSIGTSQPKKFQYFNNKVTYDIISDQLAQLPLDVLQSLRFASLFGNRIDTEILSQIMNVTHSEMLSYLNIAASNGFLTMSPSGDFAFAHDFIVDTLMQSMPEEEQTEFHYKVGRRLWECYDIEKLDENILVVVRLLLVGERYIVKDRERIAVAKLCLRSGEQSVHISSFRSAFKYIMSGINLAGKDCWKCEYQLALDLHNAAAELAYCTGEGNTSLDISNTIAVEARCFDDALTGHDIKIRALGAVGKVQESIDFGVNILLQLGETFPAKPRKSRCYIGLRRIRKRVKCKTSESLLRLPLMTDRRKTASIKMMNQLFTTCLQVNPLMSALLAFRVISLTLDFGISATSCVGFVTLGAILSGPAQEIDEGYRLGRVGMAMYEKFKIKVWLAPLCLMYYLGIHTFKHKITTVTEPMRYAAQIGEEAGNIEESIVCELFLSFLQFETRSLFKSVTVLCELRKKMVFYGLTTIHELSVPTVQSLQTLSGCHDMSCNATYNESDGLVFLFAHFHVMMLSLIFGDVDTAAESSKYLRAFSALPFGGIDAAFITFFDGLTAIRQARKKRKRYNLKHGMKKIKQLITFAEHAPDLFLCRLYLLEAEMDSILGNNSAYPKYISAIALAKDTGNLAVAALGNESAGHYFLNERQDLQFAKMHFQDAIHFYQLWGATAKVDQLVLEVQQMFEGYT